MRTGQSKFARDTIDLVSTSKFQVQKVQLEQAIAAQESLRGTLDDAIIDATIDTLKKEIAALSPAIQQRKLATILFMDIAGHTALFQDLDPEDQMAVVDAAIERMAEKVDEHGGHVARFQGDGFKAVFGLPIAQENDPQQAIRAGLAIQKEANAIAKELEGGRGLAGFSVRVGITTGMVFSGGATEGEDTIKGPPVNLAARLENAAEPGTILISHFIYQHVRGVFDLLPLEPIQAKGFADPVAVYRILRAKARPFYRGMRGVEGVETRMVGRDRELDQLQERYYDVLEDGERAVITVWGEAGLGKSRLLYEFESWVDLQPEKFGLYKGRARLETRNIPYRLLRDVFAFQFGIQDDDAASRVQEKLVSGLGEALGRNADGEMKSHFIGQLLGYDFSHSPRLENVIRNPKQLRDRALLYLGDYFEAASNHDSILILLEDLHWADHSSLDAINYLALKLVNQPILLVIAARVILRERRPHWGEGQLFHQHIKLQPLSKRYSRHLVTELLQRLPSLPVSLRELVVDSTEGNPFYLEELIKMLVEIGVIARAEPYWRVDMEILTGLHLPSTLTGVLQARLESLPAEERIILQQASVVGRVFWDRVLERIGESDGSQTRSGSIAALLDELRSRELVFRRETSDFSDAREHIFKHALLREVTYESVLKRVRTVYHGLVAEWLIDHSGERVEEITGLIADHLEQAGKDTDALVYLLKAGEEAAANYAHEEAVGFFTRALSLTPKADLVARYELTLARETAYGMQAAREAQMEDLESLERLVAKLGQPGKEAEVALRQSLYAWMTDDFPGAIKAGQRAISLADSAVDPERSARGQLAKGRGQWSHGDFKSSRVSYNLALELSRALEQPKLIADSLRNLGYIAEFLGEYAQAKEYQKQALANCRQIEDWEGEGWTLITLGSVHMALGDFAKADVYLKQGLENFRNMDNRVGEGQTLTSIGHLAGGLGDYARAKVNYERSMLIFRQMDGFKIWPLLGFGLVANVQGEYVKAFECIEQALTISRQIGNHGGEGFSLNALGDVLLGLGDLISAVDAYQNAVILRKELGQAHLEMDARAGLARVALALPDLLEAQNQVGVILSYLEAGNSLDGTEAPLRIFLTCYQVLQAIEDSRAGDSLAGSYNLLQEQAAKITDENIRRSFLQNVPWHREIAQLWEDEQKKST